MAYIKKDSEGDVVAFSVDRQNGKGWEEVDNESLEYIDFLEASLQTADPFRESDIHLARVLEDLISLLIDRDLIRFTDFPNPAQKRLIERQSLRRKDKQLNLIDDESGLF